MHFRKVGTRQGITLATLITDDGDDAVIDNVRGCKAALGKGKPIPLADAQHFARQVNQEKQKSGRNHHPHGGSGHQRGRANGRN